MLAVIRIILLAIFLVLISIYACIFSLLRPFHRNNVYHAAHILGKLSKLLGITLEIRLPYEMEKHEPVVYVCNHQNSYDLFTVANAVQPHTVSIGKKSLKWIPFFGQMYWLTGNILIDRKNTNKAMNTIATAADKMKEKKLSVWLFPEGTRSYGRGLLKFKTGAFRTAVQADAPIVPVCASNTHGEVNLNRWNNGKMIIEFLPPVYLTDTDKENIRALADRVRASMLEKINEISTEVGTKLPNHDAEK
ncbi:1-acylglycerol-3-phosphate O-acyltransferase [Thalassotalea sp. M1531]|uniref:1-acyl-sn-glycerol-3-phosphate acyltransferase n=1 Tax=Thalassotalea algicola TaxID=2716224 RepID=A0A7Y0Q5G4_9GAMM|nr:1-acylglycerol-3-phosphate O-acyltransferase [Thalassotalea algicola]NMP30288.1 1-acylglycerol-3-phosphate O-acyltransferase [Thalassotalea algicola]